MKITLAVRVFFISSFTICTTIVKAQHGGGQGDTQIGSSGSSDIDKMPAIAEEAKRRGEQKFCAPSDQPPDDVKCAHQASLGLEAAGINVKDDGVLNLVEKLESRGWVRCDYPVLGGIAASNPDIPNSDDRSHIGLVGQNDSGALCITHNSGGDGGCMVRTGVGGDPCDNRGDAGSAPFNLNWVQNLAYYAPTCTPGPHSGVYSNTTWNKLKKIIGQTTERLLSIAWIQTLNAKTIKKIFFKEEEKISLVKEIVDGKNKWKVERKSLLLNGKAESTWYVLSGFDAKSGKWIEIGADQSLWRFAKNDPWTINGAKAKIFKTPSLQIRNEIFLAQLNDLYPIAVHNNFKMNLENNLKSGKINEEEKWILSNYLKP